MHRLVSIFCALMLAAPVAAQTKMAQEDTVAATSDIPVAPPNQDFCISVMAGFPNNDLVARYQFFKLTKQMAIGATPAFQSALTHYGDGEVGAETPVMDVVEAIANPVIRQAAPDIIIAHMQHLINFTQQCEIYIEGQIASLSAFNPDIRLNDPVVAEDALYLRQILSDSLMRLGAQDDPRYSFAVNSYATSLIAMRDNIEFQAYASEIGEIEALYMTDLDGRLARSNNMINSEINRETLGDAVQLADDMNREAKKREKQRSLQTLLRILNRY